MHDMGIILTAISGILATLWGIGQWISARRHKSQTETIVTATTAAMQAFIARQLLHSVDGRDPASYYTLEILFPCGETLRSPMIPGVPIIVLENVTVNVTSQSKKETIATLVCKGFGHIGMHSHPSHHESIRVETGTMTCMATGRIYREGDVWNVAQGEMHGAYFQDCVLIIRYTPPLPTAEGHPVCLEPMKRIYP